jgi:hypothetical protein
LVKHDRCRYVAPLGGTVEHGIADALAGTPNGFILIEFKRTKLDIPSEESLFDDYQKAAEELSPFEHHHIIFGAESPHEPGKLTLCAQTYFHGRPRASVLACLDHSLSEGAFRMYLELLLKLKTQDGRSSDGQIAPEALSTVLGLSSTGSVVQAVPLFAYAPDLFPVPVQQPVAARPARHRYAPR